MKSITYKKKNTNWIVNDKKKKNVRKQKMKVREDIKFTCTKEMSLIKDT